MPTYAETIAFHGTVTLAVLGFLRLKKSHQSDPSRHEFQFVIYPFTTPFLLSFSATLTSSC